MDGKPTAENIRRLIYEVETGGSLELVVDRIYECDSGSICLTHEDALATLKFFCELVAQETP